MRKKFILLLVMIMALAIFMAPASFAQRSLFKATDPSTVVAATGSTLNTGTQLVTGQCNLQSITVSGFDTTAGDYVLIYDGTDATGTAKFDVTIGTAKGTVSIPLHDTEFGTGVFAASNSDTVHISIEYTQQ